MLLKLWSYSDDLSCFTIYTDLQAKSDIYIFGQKIEVIVQLGPKFQVKSIGQSSSCWCQYPVSKKCIFIIWCPKENVIFTYYTVLTSYKHILLLRLLLGQLLLHCLNVSYTRVVFNLDFLCRIGTCSDITFPSFNIILGHRAIMKLPVLLVWFKI